MKMRTVVLILAAIIAAVPAFSDSSIDSAIAALKEIQRIGDALDAEKRQPQSGDLASLKWQLGALQRRVELVETYRVGMRDQADLNYYRTFRDGHLEVIELIKRGIEAQEETVKRTGHERPLPCTYFFEPISVEAEMIVKANAASCITDMPYKYPAAWARLKAAYPLVEFSKDAPPPHKAIYRAFVESGTVKPPAWANLIHSDTGGPPPPPPPPTETGSRRNFEVEAFVAYVVGATGLPRELQPIVRVDYGLQTDACGLASMDNGRRVISYNPGNSGCPYTFKIPEPPQNFAGDDWDFVQLMAHELGHHAGAPPGSNRMATQEEANEWSGWALYKLGASADVIEALKKKELRKNWRASGADPEAVTAALGRGWNRAQSEATGTVREFRPDVRPEIATKDVQRPARPQPETGGLTAAWNNFVKMLGNVFTLIVGLLVLWLVWQATSGLRRTLRDRLEAQVNQKNPPPSA